VLDRVREIRSIRLPSLLLAGRRRKDVTPMTRGLCLLMALLVTPLSAPAQRRGGGRGNTTSGEQYPPVPRSDLEKRILATIDNANRSGAVYANVPASDGRLLRLLTETANAKHVVEIGTSTGLSGLWFCMALERTGGKLTTFEFDVDRAATARKHFAQAGVERLTTLVEGDAHQTIARLKEPIDIVFIDADKEGYVDYLTKLRPLVRPGGLILAHNVNMVPDYVKEVTSSADLETVFYVTGGGLAVTLKKR
jgi:caffeoyl-CoA O-methyltransferase